MEIDNLKTYQQVIKDLENKKRQKHLLLGNGFSMSYDPTIFSYNALAKFLDKIDNQLLKELFEIIKTNNFELLMEQLENFSKVAKAFGVREEIISKINNATFDLKKSLIDAIKELHPNNVFSVSKEKSEACANFLKLYLDSNGNIFTTNYDLLLYWVLMRNELDKKGDGFGREREDTDDFIEEENKWSELRWGKNLDTQSIFYVHGALHLFDTGIDVIKEEYTDQNILLENIKKRMDRKEYPIFVTAGHGEEKLSHIRHNRYLSYCYDSLSEISGSLICFGFGFGEYDGHIIDAINKACKKRKDINGKWHMLHSIYIGVYSDDGLKYIKSIEKKFKMPVRFFNSRTLNIWNEDL